MNDAASYDDRQLAAALVTCAACARSFYMTVPQAYCACCREASKRWGPALLPLLNITFTARDLLERAAFDDTLRHALGGATTANQVGRRLRLLAGHDLHGCRLVCVERHADGRVWVVERHEPAGVGVCAAV